MEINNRILRLREDIRRTEGRIRELDGHLKALRLKEKQMVDEEIIRQVRGMGGKGADVLEILARAQELIRQGQDVQNPAGPPQVTVKQEKAAEHGTKPLETKLEEREDKDYE